MNYDDAVRFANQQAREHGWIMLQDTAWEGYEDVPGWIMEGYLTLALEAYEQLQGEEPTHIFLQAGVGAFAGSAAGFFTSVLNRRPVITIVEPDKADCLYRTARANDGQIHFVTGDMDSMMGRTVLRRTLHHRMGRLIPLRRALHLHAGRDSGFWHAASRRSRRVGSQDHFRRKRKQPPLALPWPSCWTKALLLLRKKSDFVQIPGSCAFPQKEPLTLKTTGRL